MPRKKKETAQEVVEIVKNEPIPEKAPEPASKPAPKPRVEPAPKTESVPRRKLRRL